MDKVDLTIVGGGPVGLFASFYAGLRGMSVRIIDSLPELGGQLTALYPEKYVYDMPGFPKVLAKDLAASLIEQGMQFGAEAVLEETCDRLVSEGEDWVIETTTGQRLPTRSIIVSAGAGAFSPTRLGVPREEEFAGKGLNYGVKSKSVFEGRKVLVVGGGDSAFDWTLNLLGIASELAIVHRRDQFRAHEETVKEVQDAGVGFHLWQVVKELHGEEGLCGVTLENTQTKETTFVEADAVVVNIGFKSSLGPIKDWGFEIVKNQIVVDSLFRTSLSKVFAVGDVSTFEGKLKLIATGVGEAATAVCVAKTMLDPTAKLFPGHSSEMALGG